MNGVNRRMTVFILMAILASFLTLSLGARGNSDSDRIEDFNDLLTRMESGELSREEALKELDVLGDKFQVREEHRERLTDVIEGFGSGEMNQDAALLQIRETLQVRNETHEEGDCEEEVQTKTQNKTQTKSQDQSESQPESSSSQGEGKGK